jgi:hypothetical protein
LTAFTKLILISQARRNCLQSCATAIVGKPTPETIIKQNINLGINGAHRAAFGRNDKRTRPSPDQRDPSVFPAQAAVASAPRRKLAKAYGTVRRKWFGLVTIEPRCPRWVTEK